MELTPIEGHTQELPEHAQGYKGGFVELEDGRFILVVKADKVAEVHVATQEKITKLATIVPEQAPFYYQYNKQTNTLTLQMGKKVVEISLGGETAPSEWLTAINWSRYWPFSGETSNMIASTTLFALSLKLRECLQA